VEIKIELEKTLEENAARYFEKSKKAKHKAKAARTALTEMKKKLELAKKQSLQETFKPEKKRDKQWFEKFHWMFTSNKLLVIGGRDSKQNELIIKKYTAPNDLFFHAEIQGAPHCILKCTDRNPKEQDKKEAATFAAIFSKAWKLGYASIDVYSAKPEQLSKKAPSGEALGTGAFMVYGKREWFRNTELRAAIGVEIVDENTCRIISGPISAVSSHTKYWLELVPDGNEKGKLAKIVKKELETKLAKKGIKIVLNLDEIIAMLPNGKSRIHSSTPNE
jgi:hypothetical protein